MTLHVHCHAIPRPVALLAMWLLSEPQQVSGTPNLSWSWWSTGEHDRHLRRLNPDERGWIDHQISKLVLDPDKCKESPFVYPRRMLVAMYLEPPVYPERSVRCWFESSGTAR